MEKYPRTPHLEGSRIQFGDQSDVVPFETVRGLHLVVEEKMDGSNSGISFVDDRLMLQSRGHYLTGGDHGHFDLFKSWGRYLEPRLRPILGNRYVMFGEWLYATHAIHYDRLPHYFMEFDIMDRETGLFLDTPNRKRLLKGAVSHVRVIRSGQFENLQELTSLVGPSEFISDLPERVMEGLYIKHEEGGHVRGRYKFVRSGFLQKVVEMGDHWSKMPMRPNLLREKDSIWT